MAHPVDSQTISGFYEEARGYLEPLDFCLLDLSQNPGSPEVLAEMRRLIHLIRGASAVVGLNSLTALSQDLEVLLEELLNGEMSWEDATLEVLTEAIGAIHTLLTDEQKAAPPPPPRQPIAEVDREILKGFLLEAEEALAVVSSNLSAYAGNAHDQEALRSVRRAVHTIKGAGAMVGLEVLSSLAHRMEDLLDALADSEIECSGDLLKILFETADLLSDLVNAGGSHPGIELRIPGLLARYPGAEPGTSVAAPPPSPADAVVEADETLATQYVRAPLERVDDLLRLTTEVYVHRSSLERTFAKFSHELQELSLSIRRLHQIHGAFEQEHKLYYSGASQNQPGAEFDPLELDRYTQLYTHSRDLGEASADVAAAQSQLRGISAELDLFLQREKRLVSEMQERLMRFRMVPLSTLEARLQRTVRTACGQANKEAGLLLEGASTEIDKSVLDALTAPLEHLLRNAVAHGIESPEARAAASKPVSGALRLAAFQDGSQITIRLSDDGAGLDIERIRARAVLRGLVDEDSAAALPDSEVSRFLFMPGFSTSEQVDELSGRGVGLDVVKSAVEALKGALQLESTPGQGAVFTLRLPLTMAVAKVMMIESRSQRFALPISGVAEVARLPIASLTQRQAKFGPRTAQLYSLGELLGLPAPLSSAPGITHVPVALLKDTDPPIALELDRILEAREIVIKPLSNLLQAAPHLSGATLLGDGSIVPVLNPVALLDRAQRPLTPAQASPRAARASTSYRPAHICVVDDSLSVRRVISALMERQGWTVTQAKDGLEALQILRKTSKLPDLLLLDVEMPRMDGYELTTTLRADPLFAGIPIVMLTSRSAEKHRAKAMSVGVTEYLLKPYQDDVLLGAIRSHISKN
jgi:chemosensory pili system protein ChpA (sensor histidine kinase/response regulator)